MRLTIFTAIRLLCWFPVFSIVIILLRKVVSLRMHSWTGESDSQQHKPWRSSRLTSTPLTSKERHCSSTTKKGYANAALTQISQGNDTTMGLCYCWSHGLGRNPAHISTSCTNKAHVHCTEATLLNLLARRQQQDPPWMQ